MTALSGAKIKIGFDKNPLSFLFTNKISHLIPHSKKESFLHEVQRNAQLLAPLLNKKNIPKKNELKLKMYFDNKDHEVINKLRQDSTKDFFVLAPSSVWFTKQWHADKWRELIIELKSQGMIYLIGAPSDNEYLTALYQEDSNIVNLAGSLSLRQSALLMKDAKRVFVNDSAPLHLASSVNAKVTAIFCSTVPDFGYSPVSDYGAVVQVAPRLECMPCGLHGHKSCPKGHFNCSHLIEVQDVLKTI